MGRPAKVVIGRSAITASIDTTSQLVRILVSFY